MYNISGKNSDALVTIDNLDSDSVQQLYGLMMSSSAEGSHIAIMPDGHPGTSCLVGFTQRFTEDAEIRIVPNYVGGDIACGIFAWPIGKDAPDLNKLDAFIRENIPHGPSYGDRRNRFVTVLDIETFKKADDDLDALIVTDWRYRKRRVDAVRQLCSLGGGNHFISLERSENTGEIYLIVHTGSRQFGKTICQTFQKMAKNAHPTGCPSGLEYLAPQDDGFEGYLKFMDLGIEFARRNKEIIASEIMSFLGCEEKPGAIKTNHNSYDRMERTIRKGSVSAQKGETFLCPVNMRDGTFICVGKGNADWNCSAPHGAGRLMSRREAKATLDLDVVKESLGDLFTTTIATSIDEAPAVYKSFEFIRENITPTADIVDHLKPIYNFKG